MLATLEYLDARLFPRQIRKGQGFLRSRQLSPGIYVHTTDGEANFESVASGMRGILIDNPHPIAESVANSLSFLEGSIRDRGWPSPNHIYTMIHSLRRLSNVATELKTQATRLTDSAIAWLRSSNCWIDYLWQDSPRDTPIELLRSTSQVLLALREAGDTPEREPIPQVIARLRALLQLEEIWGNNRNLSWGVRALLECNQSTQGQVIHAALLRLTDHQNENGSWGPAKGALSNVYHTARILEILGYSLREGGVDTSRIIEDRVSRESIHYASAFIAFGSPDFEFAQRLYKELAARGVRCWLYNFDATPGQPVWAEIEERRRSMEKMLVVCSVQGLLRSGILKELEDQINEDPNKIIPVVLDTIWRAENFQVKGPTQNLKPFLERITYVDFSNRDNITSLEGSLTRLLGALEAASPKGDKGR